MSIEHIIISIIGGFLAGVINTLSGNGSTITLGILTELLGMPGNLANGTNRIGLFVQGIFSLEAFHRNKKIDLQNHKLNITIGILGAILGAYTAIKIDSSTFIDVYKFLLVGLLIVLLIHPERWTIEKIQEKKMPFYFGIPIFFALGFYGGFIQMGMGIFFLAIMVILLGIPMLQSNAIKVFMVTTYTAIVLAMFHYHGLVDWKIGAIIAIGQGLGGWITAQWSSTFPRANLWSYRLLIFVMILTIIRVFHFDQYILEWIGN